MSETVEAFPLSWPLGRKRTMYPAESNFETTTGKAYEELAAEVSRLGGRKMIMSSNLPLRRDGAPYATHARLTDNGVAVYFERNGKRMCFACDRWNKVGDNMRAITKTIDALRGIARWGTGDMLEAAFTGFTALPAPGATTGAAWHQVFGVPAHTSTSDVEAVYRRLRSEAHPDRPTGSHNRMAAVNVAYDQFKAERGLP